LRIFRSPSQNTNQVCSVGGGGLYAGIVQGLQRHGLSHVPVIAVETKDSYRGIGLCVLQSQKKTT
jgi:threonine dehydratase